MRLCKLTVTSTQSANAVTVFVPEKLLAEVRFFLCQRGYGVAKAFDSPTVCESVDAALAAVESGLRGPGS
jgi:hypothetical protein